MRKDKTTSSSGERNQAKRATANRDSQAAPGGELHQIAGGARTALTSNQGVALADNQDTLRANPRRTTLLQDLIRRETGTLRAFRNRQGA